MGQNLTIESVEELLRQSGAKDQHIERFWRNWYAHRPLDCAKFRFPRLVSEQLESIEADLKKVFLIEDKVQTQEDSAKIIGLLQDGQMIESVLLPRQGLCVSTQVGCAVGCKFCMTGKGGLIRQMSDLEIVAQFVECSKIKAVKKVVFMGMGEPSHNLKAVLNAVDHLAQYARIGYKELVVSTVGDERLFDALLTREIKPALAISLHSVFDEKRLALLPKAPQISVRRIMEFARQYAKLGAYPIQFQWTLIAGLNDSNEEIDRLIELWEGQFAILNMIPVNAVPGSEFERPSIQRLAQIQDRLKQGGILLKYRDSAAQEVEGGCGQLRARKLNQTQ